jgi:hypothetical protein
MDNRPDSSSQDQSTRKRLLDDLTSPLPEVPQSQSSSEGLPPRLTVPTTRSFNFPPFPAPELSSAFHSQSGQSDTDTPLRTPSEERTPSPVEPQPPRPRTKIIITNTEVESIIRVSFPDPGKYDLPGLFKGDDISEFIEYFEKAYVDYAIKDVDKIARFSRWCKPETTPHY